MLEQISIEVDGQTLTYQPLLADLSDYWDFLDRTKTSNNVALGQLFVAWVATHDNVPPKTKNELLTWARTSHVHVEAGEAPDPTQPGASRD